MKDKRKRLIWLASVTTIATWMALGLAYGRIERPRPVSQLEAMIASLPLGLSPADADALIGSAPDTVTEQDGILATPLTMFAVSNEQGRKYGDPQTYSLRMWERDGVKAVVAIDGEGKVAGRWTWR